MTPTSRALIAAARAGLAPDPTAAARVRAKLDARLAAPAAATGLSLKLLGTIAIVGGIATFGALSGPSAQPTAAIAPALVETAATDMPVHVVAASTESPAPPVHAPAHAAPAATARAAALAPAQRAAEISLAREVELIDRAMTSLRAGHANDALAAITLYHRETADRGQLLEDASAIDIEASCTLHLDVSSKLAAFDRAWPSSAQRSRLTNACP
ncbi:MAG: hypothetical protein JO257_10405 [Deltaproteobacteria bacterium]|nr:hypothetical protein [Deltaproteobacteria bacterium]